MISPVRVQRYNDFPYDEKEILRYAGCRNNQEDDMTVKVMHECIQEVSKAKACTFSVSYRLLPILSNCNNEVDFEAMKTTSSNLSYCVRDCDYAVFMAATIGQSLDRIIRKYASLDPVKALLLQAIGAERVEQMCDAFCADIPRLVPELFEGSTDADGYKAIPEYIRGGGDRMKLTPRYSPGYGDFSLSVQPEFLRIVDASRKIGITVNDSLLMSPTKSVTAIIGIKENK